MAAVELVDINSQTRMECLGMAAVMVEAAVTTTNVDRHFIRSLPAQGDLYRLVLTSKDGRPVRIGTWPGVFPARRTASGLRMQQRL